MTKVSGGDEIPAELFHIVKDYDVKVLHSICQQIWKLSSGHRTGKGQFSFQSQRRAMPKMFKLPDNCTYFICQQGNAQNPSSQSSTICEPRTSRCSSYQTIHISHASKVMLKILQARLQQYVNQEIPDVQAGFRKGRGTRSQVASICQITEKAKEFKKNIYFCFTDCAKAFDCVDHSKLWKTLKEMGIPDHLTCCLRNVYAHQETSQNWTWNDGLFQPWERSTSRLYIVTLLI